MLFVAGPEDHLDEEIVFQGLHLEENQRLLQKQNESLTSRKGGKLLAVSVRDGEIAWREEETGRAVRVRGWRQDLEAPRMGELLARLQRLGGQAFADLGSAAPPFIPFSISPACWCGSCSSRCWWISWWPYLPRPRS